MSGLSKLVVDAVIGQPQLKNIVAIYPGRFHPPGIHHATVFRKIQNIFGRSNSFVASSNKVQLPKSPLQFADKAAVWKKHGVQNILQTNKLYTGEEYFKGLLPSKFKPYDTAIVFMVGGKDADRLGSWPKWYTKITGSNPKGQNLKPYQSLDETGKEEYTMYWMETPVVSFTVPGHGKMDGTAIRTALGSPMERSEKEKIFKHVIGFYNKSIYDRIVPKFEQLNELGITEKDIEDFVLSGQFERVLKEVTSTGAAGGRSTVDDGPNYHFPDVGVYQRVTAERAEQIGYTVIDYVMKGANDRENVPPIYPDGPVDAVSFLPAGVAGTRTAMNQEDLIGVEGWNKWFDHVTRVAGLAGYELLKTKEERIRQAKERAQSSIQSRADVELEKSRQRNLMESKRFIENYHKLIDASDTIDSEVKELIKLKKGDTQKDIKRKLERAYSSHSLFREAMRKIIDNRSDIPSDAITYNNEMSDDDKDVLRHCVEFTLNELGIDKCPPIMLTNDREDIVTTAYYNIESHQIKVYTKGRALADVLRSVVHEIVHHQQNLEERIKGVESIDLENEAHSRAGEIITKFKEISKKNIYINESKDVLNESDLSTALLLIGVLVGQGLGAWAGTKLGIKLGKHGGIRKWIKHASEDRKIKKIVTRLKDDEDIKFYLDNPRKAGLKKTLMSKLSPEEQKYIDRIRRKNFQDLNESMRPLNENPDVITAYDLDGNYHEFSWRSDGMAFGYYEDGSDNPMHLSDIGRTHAEITDPDGDPLYIVRAEFKFPGRLWHKEKVISFWEYPSASQFKKVIKDLNDALRLYGHSIKIDNSWKVEILIKDGNPNSRYMPKGYNWGWDGLSGDYDSDVNPMYGTAKRYGFGFAAQTKVKGGFVATLVPISMYAGSEDQVGKFKVHVLPPVKKAELQKLSSKWKKALGVATPSKRKGSKKDQYRRAALRRGIYAESTDVVPGGLADGKSLEDIAKKHKVSVDVIKSQLVKGTKVELEHTSSKKVAAEIALDHIYEDPKYYDNLQKVEKHESIAKKKVLTEGGAYGHLQHPFDNMNLTFGILKQMVWDVLRGNIEYATEKTDGQNLMMSWKNGKAIFARNKGHIKNFGVNALDVGGVRKMFSGRGAIEDAFGFAANDLQQAVAKLTDKQRNFIFNEGTNWMSFEVIYPETTNVIPYGHTLLSFHGAITYNEDGRPIGEVKNSARILAGMIKQVNGHVQDRYQIDGPPVRKIPVSKDFRKSASNYIKRIVRLQKQFKLKDTDSVAMYHQRWWENFIDSKHSLPEIDRVGLVRRWAFGDKSFRIRNISDEKVRAWANKIDKENHADQIKANIRPFEMIFLEMGAEVLSNMNEFLAINPDKKVQQIRKDVKSAINKLKKSNDIKTINFLRTNLEKLNAIGGLEAIVPSEGLVFNYKGNIYKLTGAFAPVNQILGYMKFGGR